MNHPSVNEVREALQCVSIHEIHTLPNGLNTAQFFKILQAASAYCEMMERKISCFDERGHDFHADGDCGICGISKSEVPQSPAGEKQ